MSRKRKSILLVESPTPLKVWLTPIAKIHLTPGTPVNLPEDQAKQLLAKADGKVRLVTFPPVSGEAVGRDSHGSILAVKIAGSIIGEYWLCLSDTDSFDPSDDLPVYRPSEIRALSGNGYDRDQLEAIHRAKVAMDGRIVRAGT
jgi:hypothetical protein